MDLSNSLLFYLLGILLLGVNCQRPVKDRKKGALIGKLKTLQHKVSGTIWAIDEDTLYVEDFHYDGLGPDAYFWMGNDTQPSPRGFVVPYPSDSPNTKEKVLPGFQGENLIIHLPPGKKIEDMKYLSVWCRRFTVDFGHVLIPSYLDPPRKRVLPEFKRLAHGVRSGNVTILDAKTLYIPNLHYDGAGPDAYFWVGKGRKPDQQGQKVPNEMNSYDILRGYEGEDIEIQLPNDLTVYDIDYLSIWCVAYRHDFGHVNIPAESELWVPPALGQTKIKSRISPDKPIDGDNRDIYTTGNKPHTLSITDFDNCRQLTPDLQVHWQARDAGVEVRLTGRISPDEYIAFGISSDKERPQMLNSDVVVVYYDSRDGSYHAVDYTVTGRSQCDGTFGVCPDERVNGQNDAVVITGERHNGITSVTYRRPYEGSDRTDISINRRGELVQVIAAIGTLNARKEANYHHEFVTKDRESMDFLSVGENTCTPLVPEEVPTEFEPWPINFIRDTHNLSVAIGPTGGQRGYSAITGNPSWGIAFWVNDMLIPELHVERGQTYYFTVEGGDDLSNPAKHHPFYITDSSEGGFNQKTIEDQKLERVFAGVSYSKLGTPQPNAQGRLCEWKHKGTDSWEDSLTFDEYRSTLHRMCEPGRPGSLTWTVMEDTPDLVYYQCYTHRHLGWKVHVHDPGFNLAQSGAQSFSGSCLLLAILTAFATLR